MTERPDTVVAEVEANFRLIVETLQRLIVAIDELLAMAPKPTGVHINPEFPCNPAECD